VILLDHNIPVDQATQLRRWRIRASHVGFQVGRPEWQDQEELLRYLQGTKRATLFTRDLGFFHVRFCHPNYGIVVLAGPVGETATDIRWLLRSSPFRTQVRRSGCVIKVLPETLLWRRFGTLGRLSLSRGPVARGRTGGRARHR